MSELLSGEVLDMVVCLTEERASLARGDGARGMPLAVVAARAGIAKSTIRAWEGYRTVPSLPLLLRVAAVFELRMALVDTRGRRWDLGVTQFAPAWLEAFAALEMGRLAAALGRARRVKGVPVEKLGCLHVGGAVLWGTGHGLGDLELVIHRAASVGLCASLEPLDDLPAETPDEDPAALLPDDGVDSS